MPNNPQITLDANLNWQATNGVVPTPDKHSLLIKVQASSVNPVDLKRRSVTHTILGYDGYGEVLATGTAVTQFQPGDHVFYAGATRNDGSFQTFQSVPAAICALAPTTITPAAIAGLPLVSLTAYELLFEKAHFKAAKQSHQGKQLLIINGAGGVGTILSQLAKWAGFTVTATSSPTHFDWLLKNGVDWPVDYHESSDQITLADLPDNQFDAILVLHDIGPYLAEITRLIKPFGQIGTIVGTTQPLDLAPLKAKSASFSFEYMFTKTDYDYRTASQGAILTTIAHLIDTQQIHPITTASYQGLTVNNLTTITKALLTGHATGKHVIVYN